MAKVTKDQAKDGVKAAKEAYKAARTEQRAFEKENDLAKDTDHSAHEKLGKKWSKLNDKTTSKKAALEKAEAVLAEVKKEGSSRRTIYTYPPEVKTAADKKKFRAARRAEAKRAEKGEKPKSEKAAKPEKKKKEKAAAAQED